MANRNKELSQLYATAWTEVKQAVDASDPECLLELGAPPDEYDDAVAYLVPKVVGGEPIVASDLSCWFAERYGLEATPTAKAAVIALVDELTSTQARLHVKRHP